MVEAAQIPNRRAVPGPGRDPLRQVLHDLPVGPRGARRLDELAHPLHAALAVGERALLLGEGGRGQHDVRDLRRLVHEEVLHDQEVERAQQFGRVGQVGVGEGRVLAHDVHAADVALGDGLDHVGGPHALLGRQRAPPGALETGQVGGRVVLVARQRVGHAARVAGALHVVLTAQRRDAGPGPPHLPGEQREVEHRRRVVGAVDVLGHAHTPEQAGAVAARRAAVLGGARVEPGGAAQEVGRHAREILDVLRRVRLQLGPPGVEALRAIADEGVVLQALVEDDAGHAVEHGDIGPRIRAQPEVGVVAELDSPRVEHDQAHAVLFRGAPDAAGDHRVVRGRVGADDEDAAGVLVVGVGVRRRAAAQLGQHRLDRRGVAEPRAVVDVVRGHQRARELLDQVVVLVRGLGAGERPEAAAVLHELVGDEVQRLVPARGLEPAPAPHERRGQAVGMVDERHAEAPLHAEQARRGAVRGVVVDVGDAARLVGGELDAAAHAAVGADRRDGAGGRGLPLGTDRAGGAGRHALSARRADRLAQRLVGEGGDASRAAAARDADRADALPVLAGRGAAAAEDALGRVEQVEGIAVVARGVDAGRPAAGVGGVGDGRAAQVGAGQRVGGGVAHAQREL